MSEAPSDSIADTGAMHCCIRSAPSTPAAPPVSHSCAQYLQPPTWGLVVDACGRCVDMARDRDALVGRATEGEKLASVRAEILGK